MQPQFTNSTRELKCQSRCSHSIQQLHSKKETSTPSRTLNSQFHITSYPSHLDSRHIAAAVEIALQKQWIHSNAELNDHRRTAGPRQPTRSKTALRTNDRRSREHRSAISMIPFISSSSNSWAYQVLTRQTRSPRYQSPLATSHVLDTVGELRGEKKLLT